MNRHCHRVLFNRARGLFVVCQENARSAGGSPPSSGSSAASAVRFAAVSFVAAACGLLCVDLAHGQIMADPSAPGRQRPTVLAAPNGVPVVNIQTPSAAGVSHNTYHQFDVNAPGAILNNSRGNVQTQLGGWVQGNPWLAKGPARVILHEVNSSNPSLLRGAVEVAGPRAEVIIANPSGITVNGGSFINASRVTLTTGSPVMNGGNLESYRVQRGSVLFEGRGLDAGATDYTAVLARAVQVNAGIWAKALKVVAGAHEASADGSVTTPIGGTGPAPTFLLDVAALGGMYAGHIFMAGTEAGLGVRNAGNIASTGTLTLAADGRLINNGSVQAASDIGIDARAVDNSGSLVASHTLRIGTSGDIVNTGGMLEAASLQLASTGGDIDNRHGILRQSSAASLDLRAVTLSNTQGGHIGSDPVALPPAGPAAPPTPSPAPAPAPAPAAVDPLAVPLVTTPVVVPQPGAITASGSLLNDAGRIEAGSAIDLQLGQLDNRGGTLNAGRLTMAGVGFDNSGGTLRAASLDVRSNTDIANRNGTLTVAHAATLLAGGGFDNTGGSLRAASLDIRGTDISNRGGTLATGASARLAAGAAIDNTAGSIASGTDLTLSAASLDNAGTLRAANDLKLQIAGQVAQTAEGRITAGRHLDITAASLLSGSASTLAAGVSADGKPTPAGDLHISTTGALLARGKNVAAGDMVLSGISVDLRDSQTGAADIRVVASHGDIDSRAARIASTGKLSFAATGLDNRGGSIASTGTLTGRFSGAVDNGAGFIGSRAGLDMAAAGLANDGGQIISLGPVTLASQGGGVTNRAGLMQSAADLQLDAGSFSGDGKLIAGRDLAIAVGSDLTHRGEVTAVRKLRYSSTGSFTNQALLHAGDTLTVSGRDVVNQAAAEMSAGSSTRVSATGSLNNEGLIDGVDTRIDTGTLNNRPTGRIYGDHLNIDARTLDNAAGTIAARQRLDIATTTLTNRDGGLIFSAGDMAVGETLDAKRQATGRAGSVGNSASTIEALGRLTLGAGQLDNLNVGFSARQQTTTETVAERFVYLGLNLQGPRYQESELGRCRACADDRDDPGWTNLARYEYVAPSTVYPFEAGYSRQPYLLPLMTDNGKHATDNDGNRIPDNLVAKVYADDDPVWRLFDVPVGDAYGLTQKLIAYNQDFMSRAHRDFTVVDVTGRTITQSVVDQPGVAGRIASGAGMALDIGAGRNVDSQVVAGDVLTITGGKLLNQATEGRLLVAEVGSWHKDSVAYGRYSQREGFYGRGRYAETVQDRTVPLSSGDIRQFAGRAVAPPAGPPTITPGTPPDIDRIAFSNRPPTVTPGPAGSDIRTATPDLRLPTASLFRTRPEAGQRALVVTDPRFADYRQWLTSDYLLSALGIDPAGTAKRLGDGFYEQQLVRQQLTRLTGQRLLAGYTDDDTQYAALLDGAVTFAQTYQLRPGIALSPTQMARLTSDIVWLVTQTVTLADGSIQQVLVPQLYVHVKPGDIDGDGSLLAGRSVDIRLSGDGQNVGGTIAGRDVVRIGADQIANLGGRITGNTVALKAVRDIDNLGGTVDATQTLLVDAGRDLNVRSTTATNNVTAGASSFGRTGIDRVAGLYVGDAAGAVLVASAGRDVNLMAGVIANASADGITKVSAGRDLNLGTVQTGTSADLVDGRNASHESTTAEVGSRIQAAGSVALLAGNDITVRNGTVDAAGALQLKAGRDVVVTHGESTSHLDQSHGGSTRGFLSSSSQNRTDRVDTRTSTASSLGGGTVAIDAARDIGITGSHVVSDTGTKLIAGRDVAIVATTDSRDESHQLQSSKSGLSGSGGLGATYGSLDQKTDAASRRTTAAGSTVGSIGGDVTITAGNRYTQTGSDVSAPGGDVAITGKDVKITEAREVSDSHTRQTTRQTGITVAVTSPAIAAAQSAITTTQAIGNTGDGRMKALGTASALMSANTALGNLVSEDPTRAGANVSLSIGSSQSSNTTTAHGDIAKGSKITGQNVSITATGAGQDSNLLIRGSDVTGSKTVALAADNQVDIVSAQSTTDQHSRNSSSSASLGVGYGTDGFVFNASASGARGKADGSDVTQVNSHIGGADQVSIRSGGDTSILGGVVKGDRVVTDIGGDLRIESRQDTAKFDSRQQSLGGSASVGAGKVGGSLSASQSQVNADYASVDERSGIQAGDGGFDVKVRGKTDLVGGVIASTQKAVDEGLNSFDTRILTTRDIQNRDNFSASGFSLSGGYSTGGTGKPGEDGKPAPNRAGGVNGAAAGIASASGKNSSTTTSGVSGIAGDKRVRTGDGSNGLAKTFEADRANQEVGAQLQITSTFGQQASKAIGDYADSKAKELRAQGQEDEARAWDEGGSARSAAHALIGGLTGGVGGALGAGATALSADAINQVVAGLPPGIKEVVGGAMAAGIGAAAGGAVGAATAFNSDLNNRQLHPTEIQWIKDNAKRYADSDGISPAEAEKQLAEQAFRQVQFAAQGGAPAWNAGAANFLKSAGAQALHEGGYLFYATPQQRADATLYLNSAVSNAEFYRANGLVQPTPAAIQLAAQRDAQIRGNLSIATNTAAIASATVALVGLAPTTLTWVLSNPVQASSAGIISAETAAAITSGAVTPSSMVPATQLRTQLAFQEAGILGLDGKLTASALANLTSIKLTDGVIRNPDVVRELTKDGSSILEWGKYSTTSVRMPNGQSLQIHLYQNTKSGAIDYFTSDFKVKGVVNP
ncbi:filamentous hemagglutinin N-terminal domain-containing protein [Xylophilus sp. Kf1]|nr:filamentous hemagglutinin N-terminal domain-containing protein [Xylophilus sp. Kf1]